MKVLVLCTGNSCRSIIAQGLINGLLEGVKCESAGSFPKPAVNPNAKRVLKELGLWRDEYRPKRIEEVLEEEYTLVITVCDRARESCPLFPKDVKVIHVPFEDPEGKDYEEFLKLAKEMKEKLLPLVKKSLYGDSR